MFDSIASKLVCSHELVYSYSWWVIEKDTVIRCYGEILGNDITIVNDTMRQQLTNTETHNDNIIKSHNTTLQANYINLVTYSVCNPFPKISQLI